MSTERRTRIATPHNPREPHRPCVYCGKPRPTGRRRWCSAECVDDFLVRKGDATRIRLRLRQRDKGICALCGADMAMLRRVLAHSGLWRHRDRTFLRWLGIPDWRDEFWDADHILPVVEGGGGCGLDGYRTLCIWCHRTETAALAARRATARQPQKQLRF